MTILAWIKKEFITTNMSNNLSGASIGMLLYKYLELEPVWPYIAILFGMSLTIYIVAMRDEK